MMNPSRNSRGIHKYYSHENSSEIDNEKQDESNIQEKRTSLHAHVLKLKNSQTSIKRYL